jgi:hypothetical protein
VQPAIPLGHSFQNRKKFSANEGSSHQVLRNSVIFKEKKQETDQEMPRFTVAASTIKDQPI